MVWFGFIVLPFELISVILDGNPRPNKDVPIDDMAAALQHELSDMGVCAEYTTQNDDDNDYVLFGSGTVWAGRQMPTFRGSVLSPFSALKMDIFIIATAVKTSNLTRRIVLTINPTITGAQSR